ncbi:M15 family metallopeptidase [Proteiniclasticum sp. C24MP]|uniref:M15 family metallopeptidase n=1 Tax=Proteiniclasticum sp. C24MP TaxID=3374101 RepID=UPI0037541B77
MKKHTLASRSLNILIVVLLILLFAVTAVLLKENRESSTAESELELLHESIGQLREEVDVLTSENERLVTDNDQLQIRLDEMSETLEERDSEKLKMEEENLRLIEELHKSREKSELFVYQGLVRVLDIDGSLSIDLRYATEDNFTGQRVYPADAPALLTLDTALKLKRANERFEKDGYRIRIWDGYRPKSVQEIFWELVPDPRYVADPAKGSIHNRGASVDITLEDLQGNELEMPTAYDDFSEKASRNYQGSSATARENMLYLTRIMEESGFTGLSSEWWHFDDKSRTYPLLDVDFQVFN